MAWTRLPTCTDVKLPLLAEASEAFLLPRLHGCGNFREHMNKLSGWCGAGLAILLAMGIEQAGEPHCQGKVRAAGG